MERVLVLTVGGSHEPIVRSINHNKAAFVFFLCSDDIGSTLGSYHQITGDGNVLKSSRELASPDLPNIATQTELTPGSFEIRRIATIDVLVDCYVTATEAIRDARIRFSEAIIVADYTGGTKSMTAGLVSAALDDGDCSLSMVTGLRKDLNRVVDRTSLVRSVHIAELQLARRLTTADDLFARYDYAAANNVIEQASQLCRSDEDFQRLSEYATLCRGFDAWDRFDHGLAKSCFDGLPKDRCAKHRAFLAIMLANGGHGFEMVEDILLNAARRATQNRFDDAVGRIYRAIELTAQLWLQLKYGIDTSDVAPTQLPENMRKSMKELGEDTTYKLGLRKSWELISQMPDDSLGERFLEFRPKLLSFLSVRNGSLLAHGIEPVSEQHFEQYVQAIMPFIRETIDLAVAALNKRRQVPPIQFPTQFRSS